MHRKVLCCLLLFAFLATPAGADELQQVLDGIQAKYGKAKDLTLDFEQIAVTQQMGGREKRSGGVIYFARPGKMRWDYQTPRVKQIVSDGKTLVVYYEEEAKAYVSKPSGEFDAALPMAILAGEIDLKTQYTAELLEADKPYARLKLTPKKPLGFEFLVMWINQDSYLVEKVQTTDAYGNVTTILLKNPRFDTKIPEGRFTFAPPPGVEIIDAESVGY